MRRSWSWILVAIAAAVVVAAIAVSPPATGGTNSVWLRTRKIAAPPTLAFSRGGSIYVGILGGHPGLAVRGGFTDFTFARSGGLYLSRYDRAGSGEGHGCDLLNAAGTLLVGFRSVKAQTGRPVGLCDLAAYPGAGVIFEADYGTYGSTSIWLLDPASKLVRLLAYGYSPTLSSSGRRLLVVRHSYFPGGGSYETLELGTPGRLASFRRIVPIPSRSDNFAYGSPSLSRDGAYFAAARESCDGQVCSDALVAARIGSPPRELGFNVASIRGVAWLNDTTLLVGAARSRLAHTFDLYRVPVNGSPAALVLRAIGGFALRGAYS
jgi:hypothetical protein